MVRAELNRKIVIITRKYGKNTGSLRALQLDSLILIHRNNGELMS